MNLGLGNLPRLSENRRPIVLSMALYLVKEVSHSHILGGDRTLVTCF